MPMSATFVANGRDAVVLGINQQLVQRIGARPFVFCGVVGPVPMEAALTQRIEQAVRALAAEFELRGLGSLDFMLDGDAFAVLEVNPRPPASVALYRDQRPIEAHLRACREGELPERAPTHADAWHRDRLRARAAAAQQRGCARTRRAAAMS